MVSRNTSVEKVTIEHVTIRSGKTFAAVRTALEALVPRLDDGFWTLLRFGLTDRARQELEAAATLSIFGSRDHGALLAIAGLKKQAIQYDIGNPLTASLMTRHKISAALYAPIRVLLLESPKGGVAFEYDRPVSTFGQFGDERVNGVARNSTKICRMSCRKPRTSSTKAGPSRSAFASALSVRRCLGKLRNPPN